MKIDIKTIKKNNSLVALVKQYTDLRQERGEWWGCCPLHGEKTASFAVKKNAAGDEVFYCQGCGKGGDIIKFLEYKEGLSTRDAIQRLQGVERVNVPEHEDPSWAQNYEALEQAFPGGDLTQQLGKESQSKTKVTIPMSRWAEYQKRLAGSQEALDWLWSIRGISPEAAASCHFGFAQSIKSKMKEEEEHLRSKGWICFPCIKNGEVVRINMRSITDKAFYQAPNMDGRALFNIDTVNELEPLFLLEGEFDTAIMEQADFRAVSIPSASNIKITPDVMNMLKKAPRIYLAGDNDPTGIVAKQNLAMSLGEGTYILNWPEGVKDANDFFRGPCERNIKIFRQKVNELASVAEKTKAIGFTHVIAQLEGTTDGVDLKTDPDRLHFGAPNMTMNDADNMAYAPLGTVVVLFSTYTGTGKSVFVNQIAVHEAKRGETVVVFTPEIAGTEYLSLLTAQILGPTEKYRETGIDRASKITREMFRETADRLRKTYWAEGVDRPDWHLKEKEEIELYPGYKLPDGTMEQQLDFLEYVVRVIRPSRFVIDTLMRIAIPDPKKDQGEVQAQSRAVKRFEDIAKKWQCTFVLIGQSNKEGDASVEVKHDAYGTLRGSREIKDVAYSVYLLHRKKSAREDNKNALEDIAELVVEKARIAGASDRRVWLRYERKTSRFLPSTGPAKEGDPKEPELYDSGSSANNDDPYA